MLILYFLFYHFELWHQLLNQVLSLCFQDLADSQIRNITALYEEEKINRNEKHIVTNKKPCRALKTHVTKHSFLKLRTFTSGYLLKKY